MVIDTKNKRLYTLGRFTDSGPETSSEALSSDFYCFCIEENKWKLLSEDTAVRRSSFHPLRD